MCYCIGLAGETHTRVYLKWRFSYPDWTGAYSVSKAELKLVIPQALPPDLTDLTTYPTIAGNIFLKNENKIFKTFKSIHSLKTLSPSSSIITGGFTGACISVSA